MPDDLKSRDTRKVSYIRMSDGTKEDYALLQELVRPFRAATADRVLAYFDGLHESFPGMQVDRYEHSLQTATRAFRDEADEETVVAALLHDIGDLLAPNNHAEIGAKILQPYVSPETYWLLKHHAIFQGYHFWDKIGKDKNEREKYRGHPAYEKTVEFCARWDEVAFDPSYDTMPLEAFEPMLRRIFAREPWGPNTKA